MQKLLLFIFFIFISCDNDKSEYSKNLLLYKSLIKEINIFFSDTTNTSINISKYYTDDFIFNYYPAGYKKGVKTNKYDYINSFNKMKNLNTKLNIVHSIYLPGVNEHTHKLDGSVRVYYGADIFTESDSTDFSAYQTINFQDNKIHEIWEWADYGGIDNNINK